MGYWPIQSLYVYKKGKYILIVVKLSCCFFLIYFLTDLTIVAVAREEKKKDSKFLVVFIKPCKFVSAPMKTCNLVCRVDQLSDFCVTGK